MKAKLNPVHCAAIFLTASCSAGFAAIVSYSVTGTIMAGPNGITSASISLPEFNPALGTLTAVQFDVSLENATTLAFENLTLPGAAGSAQSNIIELNDGATTLATATPGISYSEPAVPPFDGTLDFGGASGTTVGPTLTLASGTGAGIPASYIGAGTHSFTLERTAIANPIAPPGGFVLINNSSSDDIDVMVTYTFTPIPEPGAFSLVVLAGLTAAGRRRR